jgi:hypothetical protein
MAFKPPVFGSEAVPDVEIDHELKNIEVAQKLLHVHGAPGSETVTLSGGDGTINVNAKPGEGLESVDVFTEDKVIEEIRKMREELRGEVFRYRKGPILNELLVGNKISTNDVNEMTPSDVQEVFRRLILHRRIVRLLPLLFGKAARVGGDGQNGLVRVPSIGTWSAEEMKKIKFVVDDFEFADGQAYRDIEAKDKEINGY